MSKKKKIDLDVLSTYHEMFKKTLYVYEMF